MIARANTGFSRWNYLGGLAITLFMAIGVGLAIHYPAISSDDWIPIPVLQYITVCAIGILGICGAVLSSRSLLNFKDKVTDDAHMRFAMSLMTRNEKSSSSTGTPQLKPISLP
jgi:hypothetical protein